MKKRVVRNVLLFLYNSAKLKIYFEILLTKSKLLIVCCCLLYRSKRQHKFWKEHSSAIFNVLGTASFNYLPFSELVVAVVSKNFVLFIWDDASGLVGSKIYRCYILLSMNIWVHQRMIIFHRYPGLFCFWNLGRSLLR